MGLFGKKKNVETPETMEWNRLLSIALEFDQSTGTWHVLPDGISVEAEDNVITARKMLFEYIRQLKEANVYSNGAVHKFAKDQYSWVSKDNVAKCIELGKFL